MLETRLESIYTTGKELEKPSNERTGDNLTLQYEKHFNNKNN